MISSHIPPKAWSGLRSHQVDMDAVLIVIAEERLLSAVLLLRDVGGNSCAMTRAIRVMEEGYQEIGCRQLNVPLGAPVEWFENPW